MHKHYGITSSGHVRMRGKFVGGKLSIGTYYIHNLGPETYNEAEDSNLHRLRESLSKLNLRTPKNRRHDVSAKRYVEF